MYSHCVDIDLEGQSIHVDVVVVGGGVAGLSTAIKLAQLFKQNIKIALIEKSICFGGHIVSGACFQPAILDQLLPAWKTKLDDVSFTQVTKNKTNFLTRNKSIPLIASVLKSEQESSIISLGKLVEGLSRVAQSLDVDLYNGFGVNEVLYDADDSVGGVRVADVGIHKDGSPKEHFERGLAVRAKITVLAEGCHGNLTKEVINKFNLRRHSSSAPSYSLGLKELWIVDSNNHINGLVEHNIGFPLTTDTYGGSFVYHYTDDEPLVSLGLVVGLNYKNPYMNPFGELQRLKTHPKYRKLLRGGKRIGYGARTINKGGYQALPELAFPGGCIVGCGGGLLNPATLKGISNAIASGILAAEAIFESLSSSQRLKTAKSNVKGYDEAIRKSKIFQELKSVRNIQPSFNTPLGLYGMMLYAGLIWPVTKGREPFTITSKKCDHEFMRPAARVTTKIHYPTPDNTLTFDLMSSVALTNTSHERDQPSHLILRDYVRGSRINWEIFDGPEQRYCPAGVYEYVNEPKKLIINPQNCIHCKTCDIKDPTQNINWVTPEHYGGPNYSGL